MPAKPHRRHSSPLGAAVLVSLAVIAAAGLLVAGCGQVIKVQTAHTTPSLLDRLAGRVRQVVDTDAARLRNARTGAGAPGSLHGASTTFSNPLVNVWQNALAARPGEAISYDNVNSRADVQEILEGHAAFAVSEIPLTPDQLQEGRIKLSQVPVGAGSVCVIYNLPSLALPLKLTPQVLAGIYLGEITTWDDAQVQAANPNVALPGRDILTVHRKEAAGSTYVFSHYLSAISPQWAGLVPPSDDIARWPAEGRSGTGDNGVLAAVMHVRGGIGYTECGFAAAAHAPVASLVNASGAIVPPTVAAVTTALDYYSGAIQKDPLTPIVNAPAPGAYPIAGVIYLIFPSPEQNPGNPSLRLARWVLGPGQGLSPQADVAPLPLNLLQQQQRLLGLSPAPGLAISQADPGGATAPSRPR